MYRHVARIPLAPLCAIGHTTTKAPDGRGLPVTCYMRYICVSVSDLPTSKYRRCPWSGGFVEWMR